MRFKKEVESGDKLKKTVWEFHMFENLSFVLDKHYQLERESTRHKKYNTVSNYDRLSARDSNLSEKDVPIPVHVQNDIRDFVSKNLTIIKWSEYKH
jgi:hypothetical protein